jgi:putative aldouronate transport system substrate-binding protein
MKKAKRILSLLLLAVFVFTATLTGCGGTKAGTADTTTAADTTAAAETTAAVTEKKLDPYEIKWYFVGTKQYPETNLVEEELNKKMADINATVKIQVFPWGEYPNKMSLIVASGEQFDISFMGTWTNYYQNVAKGAFVDLTDLVAEKLPKFSQVIAPQFLEGPKVKGRLYGLPTHKEIPEAYGIEVDKEFGEQIGANFDSVKTYADLEPILKLAKEKLPGDIFPMHFQATTVLRDGTFDNLGDVKIPGLVKLDDADTKVINQFESGEFMNNWKLAYSWVKNGYANKNGATQGSPDYWNARKAFTRVENMGPLPEYQGSKGQIIKRVYIGNKVIATGSTVGAMMCFSKTSKDIDRALTFFDRVATDPELYNLVMYGIKDRHYRIIDENSNPKRVDYLEGQNEDSVGYVHSGGAWSIGGNWFLHFLGKADPVDRNDSIATFNQTAVSSKLLGFSFDPEPVKTEIAACENVYQELAVPLNCGAVDPDKYAVKLQQKMKEAGAEKIIAEKQKQIDQWKKDNNK